MEGKDVMGNNNVERKLEQAVVAVITRKYDGILGHIGFSNDELARPHYTVAAVSSHEMIYKSGTLAVMMEIKVKSDADFTSTDGAPIDHYDREGEVYDAVLTDPPSQFVSDLNKSGVEEFTAFVCSERERLASIEERAFVSTLRLEVICCGSVIS